MTDLAELLSAIGSIATPILILILTGLGWTIRNRIEKSREREEYLRELEEKLRDERINVYNSILKPFMIAMTKDEGLASDRNYKGKTSGQVARETILSLKYRQMVFKFALMGSDEVVRAYNNLMQHFFSRPSTEVTSVDDAKHLMSLFGNLLLEIRKSVGNEKTTLDTFEMLEWLISDIRKFKN